METASEVSITREERDAMDRKYRREVALNYAINIAVPGTESHGDVSKILENAYKFFEFLNK